MSQLGVVYWEMPKVELALFWPMRERLFLRRNPFVDKVFRV
jgi:hypothetical protein